MSVGDYSALLAALVSQQPAKPYNDIRLLTVQFGFVSSWICGLMLKVGRHVLEFWQEETATAF